MACGRPFYPRINPKSCAHPLVSSRPHCVSSPFVPHLSPFLCDVGSPQLAAHKFPCVQHINSRGLFALLFCSPPPTSPTSFQSNSRDRLSRCNSFYRDHASSARDTRYIGRFLGILSKPPQKKFSAYSSTLTKSNSYSPLIGELNVTSKIADE